MSTAQIPVARGVWRTICYAANVLVLSAFVSVDAQAVENLDDAYRKYLRDLCDTFDPFNPPPPEAGQVCRNAFPRGTGGGVSDPVNTVTNVSAVSAQARVAKVTAARERLEKLKDSEAHERSGKATNSQPAGGGASADESIGRFGFFTNLRYGESEREDTPLERGFDSDVWGINGGIDYRISDEFTLGVVVSYDDARTKLKFGSGETKTETFGATAYGLARPGPNTYADFYVGYFDIRLDNERNVSFGNISDTAVSDPDGTQFTGGVSVGHDWVFGAGQIGPVARFDYIETDIDSYRESGSQLSQNYPSQEIRSRTTSLGVRGSYALSYPWGVLVPHAGITYVHEHSNNSRVIPVTLIVFPDATPFPVVTDDPDRDYVTWQAGASAVMPGGFQAFVNFEKLENHTFLDSWLVTAGGRLEF